MSKKDVKFLHTFVAPVMRAQPQVDPAAVIFELDVTRLSVARMNNHSERFLGLRDRCIDAIRELPTTIGQVKRHQGLIEQASVPTFWHEATEDELNEVIEKLGPLMRRRQPDTTPLVILDLQDMVEVKSWLEIEGRPIKKSEYQEQVKEFISGVVDDNESFAKVKDGMPLGEEDRSSIIGELEKHELHITLDNLRDAWSSKRASLEDFLKHILRNEDIPDWGEKVRKAFANFMAENQDYNSRQMQMLKALRNFVIDNDDVKKSHLVQAPFTQIDTLGFPGVFDKQEIKQILEFTEELTA